MRRVFLHVFSENRKNDISEETEIHDRLKMSEFMIGSKVTPFSSRCDLQDPERYGLYGK